MWFPMPAGNHLVLPVVNMNLLHWFSGFVLTIIVRLRRLHEEVLTDQYVYILCAVKSAVPNVRWSPEHPTHPGTGLRRAARFNSST
jgi:hypothetical protein